MKYLIKNDRIGFRSISLKENDVSKYLDWVNNGLITEYLESLKFPISEDQLLKFISNQNESPNVAFFGVHDIKNDEWIGNVKLGPIDWIHRKAYYGRLIGNSDYWGKGIGTDISKLITSYAFNNLNLNKVYAGAVANNIGSIKSNEKAGLKIEASFKNDVFVKGEWTDRVVMTINRKDYLSNEK